MLICDYENMIRKITAITLASILFVSGFAILQPQPQTAFAQQQQNCSQIYTDKNFLQIHNPWCQEDFDLDINSQFYTFTKNFRSDGSMRMDFKAKDTPSLVLAGYIRVQNGDCTATPNEEISGLLNGGPHTSNGVPGSTTEPNSWWADTMDLGVSFSGQDSRARVEPTHPDPSDPFESDTDTLPLDDDLCTGSHVGVQFHKTNLDTDCDDEIDSIGWATYVDLGGPGANDWELAYKRINLISDIENPNASADGIEDQVKSADNPYVQDIGHPEAIFQTIRIDGQSLSEWQSTTNPPYKFVTLKATTANNESC